MRSVLRGLLALAALLFLPGCVTQNQPRSAEARPGAPADPADDYIHAVMEKNHVPGVAMAVVRDSKIEKIAAYGVADLESNAKVGLETSFQIASATKVFTGTLVMLLVQEGTIGLDDPLSKYLPDAPEAWKAMTVRHLAAHASGLKDNPDDKMNPTASVAERYEAAQKAPLAVAPGERSEYALTDFVVLTHVLEKVTGQRFEELLNGRIFQPLGFSCTRFEHATEEGPVRDADIIPRRATTYSFKDGAQRRYWYLYPVHAYAGGGVFSCVKDLARWAVAMDQGTLLRPEMQRVAATAFKLNDGRAGGFGVAFTVGKLRGLPSFGHSGGGGLGDVLRVPDRKLTVIVLTNAGQRLLPVLAPSIASLYLPPLPALEEPGITDAEPALSAALRGVAVGVMNGALDAAAFAPRAQQELLPVVRTFGAPESALYPPLRRMILLQDRNDGELRRRVYRAVYGKDISLQWTFSLDAAGKVLDLDYAWE
jgi:CubicO group peptidase (beta-lactamase class C family)